MRFYLGQYISLVPYNRLFVVLYNSSTVLRVVELLAYHTRKVHYLDFVRRPANQRTLR